MSHTQSTHLTTNEYNWLGTIFYISYLVFEYPQNLALQRFPVGKWMRCVSGDVRASCDPDVRIA